MGMLFRVVYPGGEEAWGTGHGNQLLRVLEVPHGPEICYLDQIEVDWAQFRDTETPIPVLRVVGGPRRRTILVRVALDDVALDEWMNTRDSEGWNTNHASDDPTLVWVVPERDDLDPADLERAGGVIQRSS